MLGPPDPETAVLTHLHLPQWKRGLKLARTLVRCGKTDKECVAALERSCPTPSPDQAWFRLCLGALVRLAKEAEGIYGR